jgi:hypothetical protein
MDDYDGKRRWYTRRDIVVNPNTTTIWIIVIISSMIAILSDLTGICYENRYFRRYN